VVRVKGVMYMYKLVVRVESGGMQCISYATSACVRVVSCGVNLSMRS